MEHYDILIIGGGAAGIGAAIGAWEAGCRSILIADRKRNLGGVLLQCAHRGFGSDLNGPEYAAKLLKDFPDGIQFLPNVTVLSVSGRKIAVLSGPKVGEKEISFDQLILATGCREIPMGALDIVGTRPKGVYTAGQMQEMMNLYGHVPEGPVVILGSGDLGLVMAKHLAEHGLDVALVEQRATCGGMARNQRCLEEFPIRLICSDTISRIHGHPQLTGCTTTKGVHLPCKTLLIAAGLQPDRELVRDLGDPEWLHLCGNCRVVHPMVEAVVNQGKQAGKAAYEHTR